MGGFLHTLAQHRASIMSAAAAVAMVGTAIFAKKDTEKAEEIKKSDGYEQMSKIRKAKKMFICYLKTIIICAAGVVLIICANSSHISDKAILSGLGAAWGQRAIAAESSANDIFKKEEHPLPKPRPVEVYGKRTFEVYEPYSDQYITTTEERWFAAEARANKLLQTKYAVGLNLIIVALGGKPDKKLNDVGWSLDDDTCDWNWSFTGGSCIEFDPIIMKMKDGSEKVMIRYTAEPVKLETTNEIVNEDMGWC